MTRPKQYLFRPRAEQDMEGIFDYTFQEFGEAQADAYIRSLFKMFQTLANTPEMARQRNEVRPGLRSYPVNAHIVFFRKSETGITIARVLHQSMDYQSQTY